MRRSATDYRKQLTEEAVEDAHERLLMSEHVPSEILLLVAQEARNFVQALVRSDAKISGPLLLRFCELAKAVEKLQDRVLDVNVERERIEAENKRQAEGERVAQMLNDVQAEGY